MDYGATTYESSIPFPKFLATNVKIFGTIQILFGLMNFSFGVIFLFTFENPYPRYPFIFVTGYPFWSSILFINSGAFLVALERKTTETLVKMSRSMNLFSALAAMAGIILLAFGFIVDQNYLCGFSGEVSECKAITALFIVSMPPFSGLVIKAYGAPNQHHPNNVADTCIFFIHKHFQRSKYLIDIIPDTVE
ncbi:PREDICTED: membrane-spanning 4-domains subfamily A member 5-like isoform X3 [Hipposideros armiger]|nr:PREDICTED: membrane-spanning 4-domains subfamily A member 5-like isoform X3 [Hipposideros armiger]